MPSFMHTIGIKPWTRTQVANEVTPKAEHRGFKAEECRSAKATLDCRSSKSFAC